MKKKIDLFYSSFLVLVTVFITADLFLNQGHPGTMDGFIHLTSIAQFSDALKDGNFPVTWVNNFTTYGYPLGLLSHQLPLYLGALVTIFISNTVLSMTLITFFSLVAGSILYYYFLRLYVASFPAFAGSVLMALAPYRIINIYIRGAFPETFAAFFLPLLLLLSFYIIVRKKTMLLFPYSLALFGLLISHPMMIVIFSFLLIPYTLYLLVKEKYFFFEKPFITKRSILIPLFVLAGILGVGSASYYLIPLLIEKKYFVFGGYSNLLSEQFFSFSSLVDYRWYYFYQDNIFTRGHVIHPGLIEISILLVAVIFLFKKQPYKSLQFLLLVISGLLLLFMLPTGKLLFQFFPFLGMIQFPWRFLAIFIFIPPFVLALLLNNNKTKIIGIGIILVVIFTRFPQLYGKNYTAYPESYYHATRENLHSVNMNTLWTGKTEDYPERKKESDIVSGVGIINIEKSSNSHRLYTIEAKTALTVVDYTFYFPGWNVYLGDQKIPIEFQNPAYRGMITYSLPAGKHSVRIVFEDTRVRFVSKIISVASLSFLGFLFLLRKPLLRKMEKYG